MENYREITDVKTTIPFRSKRPIGHQVKEKKNFLDHDFRLNQKNKIFRLQN
jgi:hypothetical protein